MSEMTGKNSSSRPHLPTNSYGKGEPRHASTHLRTGSHLSAIFGKCTVIGQTAFVVCC